MDPMTLDKQGAGGAAMSGATMSERDLAEIIGAFNDVTAKLHGAHEALRGEVTRLKHELREANEQIERSRRLAALGEMAAGIAHEVRNPLGSIRLYARMLEQDLADRPQERAVAVKIAGAVRGLDAVVGDVLAFAREMRVDAHAIDAEALLSRAVQEGLAGLGDAAPAGLRVSMDVGVAALYGDECLLHRALVNVVRNGAEAMRERSATGGSLDVWARRAAVAEDARAWVSLGVRDSGPGIPADVLPRMFNPFFTTRATGTGLGLSIVHRIVDAHGGRVQVRNVAGADGASGAVVELLLPGGADDVINSAGANERPSVREDAA